MTVPQAGRSTLGHRSRRSDLRPGAPRAQAGATAGLTLRTGHVDGLVVEAGRVTGAVVDGRPVAADLVRRRVRPVQPHRPGRRPRARRCLRDRLRRPDLPAASRAPSRARWTTRWRASASTTATRSWCSCTRPATSRSLFVRPTADGALKDLRHGAAFEAACRAVPALAAWTDPERAVADQPGARRWSAAQHLPPAARPAGPGHRRGRRRHHDAHARPRDRDGLPAGRRPADAARRRRRPAHRRRAVRRVVRRAHPALGRGPRGDRRRVGGPLAGGRPRPRPTAHLDADLRRRPGRPADRPVRRSVLRDGGASGQPGAGGAARPGGLRDRLAAAVLPGARAGTTWSR